MQLTALRTAADAVRWTDYLSAKIVRDRWPEHEGLRHDHRRAFWPAHSRTRLACVSGGPAAREGALVCFGHRRRGGSVFLVLAPGAGFASVMTGSHRGHTSVSVHHPQRLARCRQRWRGRGWAGEQTAQPAAADAGRYAGNIRIGLKS